MAMTGITNTIYLSILVSLTHCTTIFWVNFTEPVNTWTFKYDDVVEGGTWVLNPQYYLCVTRVGNDNCASWSDAAWTTGNDWGYKPHEAMMSKDKTGKSLKYRMALTQVGRHTPIGGSWPPRSLALNLENAQRTDLQTFCLRVYSRGPHPALPDKKGWGHIELKDINTRTTPGTPPSSTGARLQEALSEVIPIPGLTWDEVFSIETQTTPRKNLWVEWVRYNVRAQNISIGCIACAAANTHLYTHALTFPDENTTTCIMNLLIGLNSTVCPDYVPLILEKPKVRIPGGVIVLADNYTCFNSHNSTGTSMGVFESGFCMTNSSIDSSLLADHTQYMYDIYWFWGNGKLRSRLPATRTGQCTLVKFAMQFKILPWDPETHDEFPRERRSIEQLHTGYEEDPQVYIDATGVPRGVPDQFKAQNQIYAGFASIIPQVQINKNVDWINYVYYSEQRFVNYSRDAFQGIVEELGPNTRMTLQNRLSLDMMWAEKGGVCGMIGEECCTYIPQNSGVNGKTMVALRKITGLAAELKTNAGVDTSFFSSWLGGLKGFLQQACLMVAGLVIMGLMVLCCVIPLYKKVIARAAPTGTFINQEIDPQLLYDDTDKGDIEKYIALDNTMQLRDLV